MRPSPFISLVGLVLLGLPACDGCHGRPVPEAASAAGDLEHLRPRYQAALTRARAWLDGLELDPLELREHGIKGKKKLVELLDAYHRLWLVAPEAERPALLARVESVAAVTQEDRYHDMLSLDERAFRQDATSYLRAALLLERLGLDTRRYRLEIRSIHPRLNDHMPRRGPHQRRTFHWYYEHFGLQEPFPLETALTRGVIAGRPDPTGLDAHGAYALTHEIYALTQYGDRPELATFVPEERSYLEVALPLLLMRSVRQGDPDLGGELLECMHLLGLSADPSYRLGVEFLLDAQNQDGSWGRYEREREQLGALVRPAYQLHTTLVAVAALSAVFDRPRPPR
jgi:hypothetical protein